jgi:predicted ATPase
VCFVELAPITDVALVPVAAVGAFGLRDEPFPSAIKTGQQPALRRVGALDVAVADSTCPHPGGWRLGVKTAHP